MEVREGGEDTLLPNSMEPRVYNSCANSPGLSRGQYEDNEENTYKGKAESELLS